MNSSHIIVVDGGTVTNRRILADRLPEVALRYLHVITGIQAAAIAACGIPLALWLLDDPWNGRVSALIGTLVVVSLILEIALLNRLRVRWTSYEVDRTAVRIRRGRLLKRNMVIPAAQLLNVAIIQGPLLSQWGLAKVTFTCIAHPEQLGPLALKDAEEIRRVALSLYTEDGG